VVRLEDRTVPSSFTATTVQDLVADINAANLTPEADTITLVAGKTFTISAADNTTHGPTGLPLIAATESLTIIGNGDVVERSSAAGTPGFRLFDVAAGASLTLQNLTLQNGLALQYALFVPAEGGAVYNQGELTLDAVTVQGNSARGFDGPQDRLTFGFPGGDAAGGGIYSSGVLTMQGCLIQKNMAIGGKGSPGAVGSSAEGSYTAPGEAGGNGFGGGVYVSAGTVTVHATTVTANTAKGGSGGAGFKGASHGPDGNGVGGGLYINNTATVGLDLFTVDHVKKNHASTSDDDIHGPYVVIP